MSQPGLSLAQVRALTAAAEARASPVAPLPSSAGALLVLQRQAGNHAVSQLIPGTARVTRQPLPLQRVLVVHLRQKETGLDLVEDLVVGSDRPRGLFAHERRHTTAWKVTIDMVRSAVVGQTIAVATGNVIALLSAVKDLPGAELIAGQQQRAGDRYNRLARKADAIIATKGAHADLASLRRAVVTLLRLRNLTPLSAVDTGPYSPGSGEARAASALRKADADRNRASSRDQKLLRRHIWALFDGKALEAIADPATSGDALARRAKARDQSEADRLATAAVRQHLASIRLAYPNAYAKAYPQDQDAVRHISDQLKLDPNPIPSGINLASRTPNPASSPSFAVAVDIGPDGRVADIRASGRPPTILGREQGSHLIAYSLHVEALRAMVTGQLPKQARRAVVDDYRERRPEVEASGANGAPSRVDNLPAKSLEVYWAAKENFTAARARSRRRAFDRAAELEALCMAWLAYRNALPLAAVNQGLALGAGEGTSLKYLHEENGRRGDLRRPEKKWKLGWSLLDVDALGKMVTLDRPRVVAGWRMTIAYPGITAGAEADAAMVIGGYLRELERAFPQAVRRMQMRSEQALAYLLIKRLALFEDTALAIGALLGHHGAAMREAASGRQSTRGMKRARENPARQDEEWSGEPVRKRRRTGTVRAANIVPAAGQQPTSRRRAASTSGPPAKKARRAPAI